VHYLEQQCGNLVLHTHALTSPTYVTSRAHSAFIDYDPDDLEKAEEKREEAETKLKETIEELQNI
jgi:hypothetical protein